MIHAETDRARNLLTVRYSQHVEPPEAKEGLERLASLLTELRPDFRLLTDMTGLESMDLGCVPYLKSMMDLCDEHGAKLVVRVIPDPHKDIGMSILSLFHYGKRVRIVTCATLKEAMDALAA